MADSKRLVSVLGSTGSIGVSTLDVIARHPERFEVYALTAYSSVDDMLAQCLAFAPRYAVMVDEAAATLLRQRLPKESVTEVKYGERGLSDVVTAPEVDVVMAAIVGAAGLPSTLAAARAGKTLLLANKESLVMGGHLLMQAVREAGARLLPIDSEHNAIFQCMPVDVTGTPLGKGVSKVLLTASGGPFRRWSQAQMFDATPDQACAHPNWSMGRKISVDSASLMNKGLEFIEACWIFDLAPAQVDVVVHPQSIVHSMVQYLDGSVLAQMGNPDMRTAIAYGLGWPERLASGVAPLDLVATARLDFEAPDEVRFPCLRLARESVAAGGTAMAVCNAANEVAVAAFLDKNIRFTDIPAVIEHTLERVRVVEPITLSVVENADAEARELAARFLADLQRPHKCNETSLMDLLYTIALTLGTLAVLVAVHEFGHFWVARRCGVQVLRFSIGFGTSLFSWRDRLGTEYSVAAIPLGGYVKMLDEREGEVRPADLNRAFNRKPALQRIAVVCAGPLANLLLAVVAYWCLFMSGESGYVPIIGTVKPDSVAAVAGLESGQEIVAVDGSETPTWQALSFRLLDRIGDTGTIKFAVQYPDSGVVYESEVAIKQWLSDEEQPDLYAGLGISLYTPEVLPVVGEVVADSPAAVAGLLPGDKVLRVDGVAMTLWMDWVDYVRARPDQPIEVEYLRGGETLRATMVPSRTTDEKGEVIGRVGVAAAVPEMPPDMVRRYSRGPLEALGASFVRTGELSMFTLKSIKKMLMGLISPKNLSGPITIAKVATDSAKSGLESYISFLALLSVSLGVLNLLPVPVLDGGHLLFYTIELLAGRPVPEKIQSVGNQVGLFLVLGIMLLALYNDFTRL